MPYRSHIPWIREKILDTHPDPRLLEIGVDRGGTMVPVIQYLTVLRKPFTFVGVDIRKDVFLEIILESMFYFPGQYVRYEIANSLVFLPECRDRFDLVLIDGDHNYYTVTRELAHLDRILGEHGVAIVDDYEGKWAERDCFYAKRDSHRGIDIVTPVVQMEKTGVKPALDEFLSQNPEWQKTCLVPGSAAVLLCRRDTAFKLGLSEGSPTA